MNGRMLLVLITMLLAVGASLTRAEIKLEATFFYDGNVDDAQWSCATLDVDKDGTIAVASTGNIGAGNEPNVHHARILLYDRHGTPIAEIPCASNTGMANITFGPDGMIYTSESWFGAGTHIYDRPGGKNRFVTIRTLRADGAHVDRGSPNGVAVTPDLQVYTQLNGKVSLLTPDDKLLWQVPATGDGSLDVGADGRLYSGNKVLVDKEWQKYPYYVMDIAANGHMLVRDPGGWAVYDPAADKIIIKGKYPNSIRVADVALGPDDSVYVTSRDDKGLAFAAIDAEGKILFQRGADYDRLRVSLPGDTFVAGQPVSISAETIRSRELGMVPTDRILPADNRPKLTLNAAVAQAIVDPLAPRVWRPVALQPLEAGKYGLVIPEDVVGLVTLRLAATPADMPGSRPLAIFREIAVSQPGEILYLQPQTDRSRTAFAPGKPVRLTVPAKPSDVVDLSAVKLELRMGEKTVWSTPLGLTQMAANAQQTAVVIIPEGVTARLRPGLYTAVLANLPKAVTGGYAVVAIIDPVHPYAFQTPAHTIGGTYGDPLLDSQLVAEWGATHITASAQFDPLYVDVLARLGVVFNYQVYGHYAALHTLPQEQGAAQAWVGGWAQRLEAFPAATGITYHDLQVQGWGGWWDAPRKPFYDNEFWPKWAKEFPAPTTIPEAKRENWATGMAVESMLTRLYGKLNSAIAYADPSLQRTTMQWWHQPLYIAEPSDVAKGQTLITAQHMEEQYYHPLTVANMTDLWRRPYKDIWVYGNASWQEDGTGALQYTDIMAALSRGAQGVGRNEAPRVGDIKSELGTRAATPLFHLLHIYGGLSAVAHPVDQIAVWRSMYQECSEYPGRRSEEMHMSNITAAYTACLYGHRTAGIITDDEVRTGLLKKYRAVIISFENPLPPDLLAPLQAFQKTGGLVLANKPAQGYWAPPGAIELGEAFRGSSALAHANRDSLRHIGIEEEGLQGAEVLRKALAGKLEPSVECDQPAVWVSELTSGSARYLWAVNVTRLPQNPMDLHRYSGYENTRLPVKATLRIRKGNYVIYDVLSGRRVQPVADGNKWVLTADMSVFPGSVFALLPEDITSVGIQAVQIRPASGAWTLDLNVQTLGAKGKPVPAAVPVEVTVSDAAGKQRWQLNRTTVNGECRLDLPITANDVPGNWRIVAHELLGGRSKAATIQVAVPALLTAAPAPIVEWGRSTRAAAALKKAIKVAVVSQVNDTLAPAIDLLAQRLEKQGKQVTRLSAKDYLADMDILNWKGFPDRHGINGDFGKIVPRAPKYDLVITLETPQFPSGVVKPDMLPIVLTATDPGPGRGLVQYAAMPVYNDEDAVCLAGGDVAGLMAAVEALAVPPAVNAVPPAAPPVWKTINGTAGRSDPPRLQDFLGVPIDELAVSADGSRIAAGLQGWGYNLIVLDGQGQVVGKDTCGKFFPLELRRTDGGFAALSHENDPTTMYLRLYDSAGAPRARLAAMGRRIGGVRDCTPNFTSVMRQYFLPQAAFSLSDDQSLAGVAGSNGIAVWDLKTQTVLWRDDAVHYDSPQLESSAWPDTPSFPQLRLSGDGKWLILQHGGKVMIREARTGKVSHELKLPPGTEGGRVQVFDGRRLVIGSQDYFGFSISDDGNVEALWHYKAPKTVTASVFSADGLHYALGEVDGTLCLMNGGGQAGGYTSPGPGGAIASLDAAADFSRIAFTTANGYAGVLDSTGKVLWQTQVSDIAVIRFAGNTGATVVGDRRGILHWFDATGKEIHQVNLTGLVWRDDIARVLTSEDKTPTLRVGASQEEQKVVAVPEGKPNLATSATFSYIPGRSWWNERISPDRSVPLNDGKKDAPANGWFNRTNLEYLAFVPGPGGWEISWKEPVTVDTLVAYEANPNAVPQEVRVDAWIDGNWKEVAHTYWNDRATHVHRFDPVTTTKLRYVPIGDLAVGVYLGEIDIYNAGGQ